MGSDARPGESATNLLVRDAAFDGEEAFLKEYETNIRHGGMFLKWDNPPPKDTKLQVRVIAPCAASPIELEAIVVFPTPAGAGVEIRNLTRETRSTLEQAVEACKASLAAKAAQEAPHPAPVAEEPKAQDAGRTEGPGRDPVAQQAPPPAPHVPDAGTTLDQGPGPTASALPGTVSPDRDTPRAPAPPPAGVAPAPYPHGDPGVPAGAGGPPPMAPAQQPGHAGPVHRPPPRRPDTTTPSWHGNLGDTPAAKVLVTLGSRHATGLLVVKSDVAESKFYFRNGSIVRCYREPPDPERRFGQILMEDAKISKTELEAALEEAKAKGLPIGQALVRRRALLASGVGKILRRQMKLGILEQVAAKEGTFAFYERVRPPRGQPMPPSSPRKVIFRGKVDQYKARLQPDMDKIEKPLQFLYVFPSPNAPEDMSEIGLDDKEIRFWNQCITGGYMLKDVSSVSNLNRRTTHGLIFALVDLELVEFQNEMAPELRAKLMKKLLRRKQAELGKANHFEVLDIHWISTEQEVKAAYAKVRKEYDCSSIAHLLPPDLIALSKEILDRIDLAYKELSTHNGRQLCRQASLESAQIVFHVDLLMQQGDMAIFKGERREAIDRFTHVLEINPGNKEAKLKLQTMQTAPPVP